MSTVGSVRIVDAGEPSRWSAACAATAMSAVATTNPEIHLFRIVFSSLVRWSHRRRTGPTKGYEPASGGDRGQPSGQSLAGGPPWARDFTPPARGVNDRGPGRRGWGGEI